MINLWEGKVMIKEIPINESHIYAFEVSGKLVAEDYVTLRPRIERLLKKEGRISLLIKAENFEGWTLQAMWEDMKIGLEHDEDFLRIAFVGSRLRDKILTEIGDFFLAAEIEYFDNESDALTWLKQVQNQAEQDEYIGYRHVLVASDFSQYSDAAIKKAVELATPFEAKITLVHIAEILSSEIYPTMGELAVPVVVNNPELEKKHLKHISKQLREQVEKLGYSIDLIELEVISGHPVDSIIEFSQKNSVDLIVMGSHGRRGLARLLGSSTNGVINHAPCDVLTVI
ncbi:MAG TPA: hypothetical protein EYH20_00585 [Leucothrix sp.]|nr:hypothetical protein [Leucothrix sp.]